MRAKMLWRIVLESVRVRSINFATSTNEFPETGIC